MSFRDDLRKQNLGLGKLSILKKKTTKKQVKPVKVVNYNINAANCNVPVLTTMQYVHCLRNINNQSTAICKQIIRLHAYILKLNISVTILFFTTRHWFVFFCKYDAQNVV